MIFIKRRPLHWKNYGSLTVNIDRLVGNTDAVQDAYLTAAKSAYAPTPGVAQWVRLVTYGLDATAATPNWNTTNTRWWTRLYSLPTAADVMTGRKILQETMLAIRLSSGGGIIVNPCASPNFFGRSIPDGVAIADGSNTWRSDIRTNMDRRTWSAVGTTGGEPYVSGAIKSNFNVLMICGPNEIDAWTNARLYYVADGETSSNGPSMAARGDVPNLAGTTGLNTLLLRTYDQMRHQFDWCREKRPDIGVLYASLIQVAADPGTREFTIYDLMRFTHSGAGLNAQGCVNDVCDAHQIHPHMRQDPIPNPWDGTNPTASQICPYHYWKANEEVQSWRVTNGYPVNTRPLLATETGQDYVASGANTAGRSDLFQLRRLKYGLLYLGELYYGVCLNNFYAVGRSSADGYNTIDSANAYRGSINERDADFAVVSMDSRESNDDIGFVAKTWRDYWKGWAVWFNQQQDPIDGDTSVCPFVEWNRVSMPGPSVTMTPGGRNLLARKKNLRRGEHVFSAEIRLSGSAAARACLRVSGHDKLNGLNLVSSPMLVGIQDWTRLEVRFTPRQHRNPRLPDPAVAVLLIDHNGQGTCEVRSPAIVMPGVPSVIDNYFDLIVTNVSWTPASPAIGDPVTFSATIKNQGTIPSPSGVIHGVRFDVDGTTVSWSDNVTDSLAAGASRVQTANGGPGAVTPPSGGGTTVQLVSMSGNLVAGTPVTFGMVFRKGEFAPGTTVQAKYGAVTVPVQTDIRNTHNDGSICHAVLSLFVPTGVSGTSASIALSPVTATANTTNPATVASSLVSAGYDVTCAITISGTTYTANAATLLANSNSGSGPLSQIIPAYFPLWDPAGVTTWNTMVDTLAGYGQPSYIIVNPNSGPHTEVLSHITSAILKAKGGGQKVIGYVSTAYGARSIAAVKTDIDRWYQFYINIDGIFFDETAIDPDTIATGCDASCTNIRGYYKAIYNYVKAKDNVASVVLNPGTAASTDWMFSEPVGTEMVIFESNATAYASYSPPSWAAKYPNSMFMHLVHGVTSGDIDAVRSKAASSGAGFVYFTERDLASNPWATLSTSYWPPTGNKLDVWLNGANVTEWRVKTNLAVDLCVQFDIRRYSNGTWSTDVIVCNDIIRQLPGGITQPGMITYDVTISKSGVPATTYTALVHHKASTWHYKVWSTSSAPAVRVTRDIAYLKSTAAIQPYDLNIVVNEQAIADRYTWLQSSATGPLGAAMVTKYMPSTGMRDDIGPLPAWSVIYLITQDARAEAMVFANANAAGSVSWHLREPTTLRPVTCDSRPKVSLLWQTSNDPANAPDNFTPDRWWHEGGWDPDVAHQPSLAYLAYLISGDRYYADELQAEANFGLIANNPTWRGGDLAYIEDYQVRGQAWSLRQTGYCAYILPDTQYGKRYFANKLYNNLNRFVKRYAVDREFRAAGEVEGYIHNHNSREPGSMQPWTDDFNILVHTNMYQMGFESLLPFLQWRVNFTAGRFLSDTFRYEATDYYIIYTDVTTGELYSTWQRVKDATLAYTKEPARTSLADVYAGGYADIGLASLAVLHNVTKDQRAQDALTWAAGQVEAAIAPGRKNLPTFGIVQYTPPPAVIGGGTTTSSPVWTATSGTHNILATVDDANRMPSERVKTNNTLPATLTVGTPQPLTFDVVVDSISWSPAVATVGQAITFSATIRNIGTGSTPSGVIHGIRFQVDNLSSTWTWSDNVTSSLDAGASRTQTANGGMSGSTWTVTAGTHTVTAVFDDANRMPTESNRTNNTLTVPISFEAVTIPTNAANLNEALNLVPNGGTISILAGTYTFTGHIDVSKFTNGVTIIGAGAYQTILDGRGGAGAGFPLSQSKGIIHTNAPNVTVRNIGFVRAGGADEIGDGEAGVYGESPTGTLTVDGCAFDDCENGIFVQPAYPNASLVVNNCDFGRITKNGTNDERAHDMYVNCANIYVNNCRFYNIVQGHGVKTRSQHLETTGNWFNCFGARAIDIPDGSAVRSISTNDTFITRPNSPSIGLIAYAGESVANGSGGLTITNPRFYIGRANSTIWNNTTNTTISVSGANITYWSDGISNPPTLVVQGPGSVTGLTIPAVTITPGPTMPDSPLLPTPTTDYLVSNRAHMSNAGLSSGNNRNSYYRATYWSTKRAAITSLRLVYSNAYLQATGETAGPNTVYITAAIEYGGVSYPVNFAGQREGTVTAGSVITSDSVSISIPTNTQFYVRNNARTVGTTDKFTLGYTTRTDFGEGWTLTSSVDGTGTLPSAGSNALFSPVAVIGKTTETYPPSIVITGSSSAWGNGENFSTIPAPGDRGYLSRLVSNNFGQSVLAVGSLTLQQWIDNSALRLAVINAIKPTHIINQLGANDLLSGASFATMQTRLNSLWADLASTGAKIIQVTYTPMSTGTFTTTSGQTPTNLSGATQTNAWIRSKPSPITDIIDVSAVTEASPDSGIWRVDGGAWTTDGVHTIRHADIAASLNLNMITVTQPPPQTANKMMIPIQDDGGFNAGMSFLTNRVSEQPAYATAVRGIFPPDGTLTYMRWNASGMDTATNVYPGWMNSGASYWTNAYRRQTSEDFVTCRKIIFEPLAGYLGAGRGPSTAPFGRTSDKALVADASNVWRTHLRWRMRIFLSTDVGGTTASITEADLTAVRNTNSNVVGIMGPNEIDHVNNWKYYYLDYQNSPDEILTGTAFSSISIADTVFNNNLPLLFLRIHDHMRHIYQGINDSMAVGGAGRTDVAAIGPSFIKCVNSSAKGTSDWTIYDWFNYEDMSTNVQLRKGDFLKWCDAMQIHIHVYHNYIPDYWAADPVAHLNNVITPWHYWRAKLDNELYRQNLGLDPLKRPMIDGECGHTVQGDGITIYDRQQRSQLRRLKYGQLYAGNLYYASCMNLLYSAGRSTNYGFNLLHYGGLSSVSTYSVDTNNRGSGYVVGSQYNLVDGLGGGVTPTFRVTAIGAGGSLTSVRMHYSGYRTGTPATNLPLATPSGGTAGRLNLTWSTPAVNTAYGDMGAIDADFAKEVMDYSTYDITTLPSNGSWSWSVPIPAKTWQDYYKGWSVWFAPLQDPIDDPGGDGSICPFTEWNFVTIASGLITMTQRGARNLAYHAFNSPVVSASNPTSTSRGVTSVKHKIACEIRVSNSTSAKARIFVTGYDKLNGLAEATSQVVNGVAGTGAWTPISVEFTPVQHNNPKLTDPNTFLLLLDHNGTGTAEYRNFTLSIP